MNNITEPKKENVDKANEFDKFFVKNYVGFQKFAKSFTKDKDYDHMSLLHDCYAKIKTKILRDGYVGDDFLNFTRLSISNSYKTYYKFKKKSIDIDDEVYSIEAECKLLELEDYSEQSEMNINRASYINSQVFEYVDKYYTIQEQYLFKTYYILKGKQLTYEQLAIATGYSTLKIAKIIRKIKKDLQQNIEVFVKTGMNMNELKLKVSEVMQLDINKAFPKYQETYREVFGKNWAGCSCNKNMLREALKDWLAKQK